MKDAEWIADLLQHGLLKASFIPSGPQRELRDLTRYRVRLTEEKAREVNRVQKTLEDTNLKLGDVVSDIMGKASRMILQAIVDGEADPGRLASLAVGRVRAPREQLEAALRGNATDHHRFLLIRAFEPRSTILSKPSSESLQRLCDVLLLLLQKTHLPLRKRKTYRLPQLHPRSLPPLHKPF